MSDHFEMGGLTVTIDDVITMVEGTSENAWQVDVVRSHDGARNCFFGHLHAYGVARAADLTTDVIPATFQSRNPDLTPAEWFASRLWEWFEEAWSTTYQIYPINDGKNARYPELTARGRVLAYLRNLRSGREMTTVESMDAQYYGLIGDEQCGVSYDHDLFLLDEREGIANYVCRRCDAEITTEKSAA